MEQPEPAMSWGAECRPAGVSDASLLVPDLGLWRPKDHWLLLNETQGSPNTHPQQQLQGNARSLTDVQLPVLVSQNPEDLPLLGNLSQQDGDVPWCVCGVCRPMTRLKEQLCCRRSKGPCVTAAPLFGRLVLSRPTLEFILLYREPLVDLHSGSISDKLRHCAYTQYIHWRFGANDMESYAVIPSCCKRIIRELYPSKDGQYSGF